MKQTVFVTLTALMGIIAILGWDNQPEALASQDVACAGTLVPLQVTPMTSGCGLEIEGRNFATQIKLSDAPDDCSMDVEFNMAETGPTFDFSLNRETGPRASVIQAPWTAGPPPLEIRVYLDDSTDPARIVTMDVDLGVCMTPGS